MLGFLFSAKQLKFTLFWGETCNRNTFENYYCPSYLTRKGNSNFLLQHLSLFYSGFYSTVVEYPPDLPNIPHTTLYREVRSHE